MEDPNSDKERCQYCRWSFSSRLIITHEGICEDNPRNKETEAIVDSRERLVFPTTVARNKNVHIEVDCLNLVVILGKDKCGKTTTLDSLTGKKGVINPDDDFESSFRRFIGASKKYAFIEPYGGIQNLITGLSLADIAILVIDSSVDFRATHPSEDFLEGCSLAKALGIKQFICCCNKMDLVQYSKEHYQKLKNEASRYLGEIGFKLSTIRFMPTSALQQENITERSTKLEWYKGLSLLEELENLDSTSKASKALRMMIHSATNLAGPIGLITGRVHSGSVVTGSDLHFSPGSWSTKVETMRVNRREVVKAVAGELVEVQVKGPLGESVKCGCIASGDPGSVKEACAFTAHLLVVDAGVRITDGPLMYLSGV